MTVENLTNVVMGELSFINMELMIVALIAIVGIAVLSWKLKKQNKVIDDLLDIVDYLDKTKVNR